MRLPLEKENVVRTEKKEKKEMSKHTYCYLQFIVMSCNWLQLITSCAIQMTSWWALGFQLYGFSSFEYLLPLLRITSWTISLWSTNISQGRWCFKQIRIWWKSAAGGGGLEQFTKSWNEVLYSEHTWKTWIHPTEKSAHKNSVSLWIHFIRHSDECIYPLQAFNGIRSPVQLLENPISDDSILFCTEPQRTAFHIQLV